MPTLTARWSIIGMLLPLFLAGCTTGPRRSASEVASPTPAREYRLVDDLCDQLDPTHLTTLTGIPTTQTRYHPVRPEARDRHLSCWLSTRDKENLWVYSLQVAVTLDHTGDADQERTPQPPERAVQGLGDHAVIHVGDTLAGEHPLREGQQVRSQTGTLRVVQGPVGLQLRWTGHGGTAPAAVDVEALLTAYGRQTLELLGG
ncbi:hypothetical protein [Micromonospora inyonensis]|uniref:hypothetical protein n=1 Tax=Micromonospora inyonensis TaxID=47866 RepID=UPI000B811701|nr:hypothetical protein [Micromonospora inyonensis]